MSGGDAEAHLREPWSELEAGPAEAFRLQRGGATFGIWVFLASEVLFFAAFFLVYAATRIAHPQAFEAAGAETNLVYGTANTAILLTSSLTMAMASQGAEKAAEKATGTGAFRRLTLGCLAATVALGLAFLVVKGFEYREDIEKHLVPGARFALAQAPAQIFFGFYWLVTLVHATHLGIGLCLVGRLLVKGWRDARFLPGNPQVEVTALYWHLVDLVWILLYPALYLPGRSA